MVQFRFIGSGLLFQRVQGLVFKGQVPVLCVVEGSGSLDNATCSVDQVYVFKECIGAVHRIGCFSKSTRFGFQR
jgi:hypothetical protein